MTFDIALLLAQDGVANGAIYVLVALGTVLIFAVTRVILVPFGDIVAYAAMTFASFRAGQRPGTLGLVLVLAGLAMLFETVSLVRWGRARALPRAMLLYLGLPALPVIAVWLLAGRSLPMAAEIALTLALVLPIAPLLYRVAFRPIADAPVLVLLIVAVALHFATSCIALLFFAPEGSRPQPLTRALFEIGGMIFPGQMLVMLGGSGLISLLLFGVFGRPLSGKAFRATAVDRLGAPLGGIPPAAAGRVAV